MTSDKPTLDWDQFARLGAEIAQWGAGYHRSLNDRPVRAPLTPARHSASSA